VNGTTPAASSSVFTYATDTTDVIDTTAVRNDREKP
jgi:hypothetical protein